LSANRLGRYVLALVEFDFVREQRDALSDENLPIVYQQSATAKRRLGFFDEARVLADAAVELAEKAPTRRHLGDAFEVHAHLAAQNGDFTSAISFAQRAFAAYKIVGSRLDCARSLTNLAQFYFDARRFKAARRALGAADRLARELQADSVRARVRILLGEIEFVDAHHDRAAALWHEAVEIARRTHDSVGHFKAEFQLFKLAIVQDNTTVVNALGRRLDRMTPWISRSEPEVSEFRELYAVHRKPKQRSVAARQLARLASRNPS
jgi:tetratricopeptide (TPR) repeat protein